MRVGPGLSAEFSLTLDQFQLNVPIDVPAGETLAVVGPNGAGKTTLLKALAGLLTPTTGTISIGESVVYDSTSHVDLTPADRHVGVMFQEPRLFTHLSVVENVAFGLRARGMDRGSACDVAVVWLERVGIKHLRHLKPASLSGGQAQRVSLARTLATEPSLLLLDEPFASVDMAGRKSLRRLLREVLDDFVGACVLVTHDPGDAVSLASKVLVLESGLPVQFGPVDSVVLAPQTQWLASMLGLNLFDAAALRVGSNAGIDGLLAVHPRALSLTKVPEGSARYGNGHACWQARISDAYRVRDALCIDITGVVDGTVQVDPGLVLDEWKVGESVVVSFPLTSAQRFARDAGTGAKVDTRRSGA